MSHRPLVVLAAAALAGAALPLAHSSVAQEIVEIQAGPGGVVRIGGAPRFDELLRPDFMRRDLRWIDEGLELDAPQRAVVELMVEDYLARFQEAAAELRAALPPQRLGGLPFGNDGAPGGMAFIMDGEGDELADLAGAVGEAIGLAFEGGEGMSVDVDVDVEESPEGAREVRVMQAVRIGGPGGGAEGGEGGETRTWRGRAGGDDDDVDVTIALADDSGILDDPEVAAHLQEIAERIRARLEERLATLDVDAMREDAEAAAAFEELAPALLAERAEALLAAKRALRREFETDLGLVLNEEQRPRWTAVARQLRRLNDLPRGRYAGESLDVQHLADDGAWAPWPEEAEALRASLAATIDAAIVARDETLERNEIDLVMIEAEGDDAQRLERTDRAIDRRTALRDANLAAVDALAALLDEPRAAAFREEAQRRAFPRVHASSGAHRALEAAAALEDLDDATRDAVAALALEHAQLRGPMDERLERLLLEDEPRDERRMAEFIAELRSSEGIGELRPPAPGESERAFAERRTMERGILKRLESIVGPERYAALPGTRERRVIGMPPEAGEGIQIRRLIDRRGETPPQRDD